MKIEKYKQDIESLWKRGELLYLAMLVEQYPDKKKDWGVDTTSNLPKFSEKYQQWYSEALVCLQQLLPSRVEDFVGYYKPSKQRKEITCENYVISDYLQGLNVTHGVREIAGPTAAISKCHQQVKIVESLKSRFESTLFDIKTLVQADLFDHELEAANELLKNGFLRAAGIVAGVVLEGHLQAVCIQRQIPLKKNPQLSDLNETLKGAGVIDIPTWRNIQFLADIRNLCGHKKTQEPSASQIADLINGVKKITKTLF